MGLPVWVVLCVEVVPFVEETIAREVLARLSTVNRQRLVENIKNE